MGELQQENVTPLIRQSLLLCKPSKTITYNINLVIVHTFTRNHTLVGLKVWQSKLIPTQKTLGVITDNDLNLSRNINSVGKCEFFHLKNAADVMLMQRH